VVRELGFGKRYLHYGSVGTDAGKSLIMSSRRFFIRGA
jgi:hypothetical protein